MLVVGVFLELDFRAPGEIELQVAEKEIERVIGIFEVGFFGCEGCLGELLGWLKTVRVGLSR